MELEELKTLWSEYDRKLDKNLQMNMQLLRKINFDKARFKMKTLFLFKLSEMIIWMFIFIYLIDFIVKYSTSPQFLIPALLIETVIITFFVMNIKILSVVNQLLLKNNNEAIAPLQKQAENLTLLIVNYAKYSLFMIPGYPLILMILGKVFLDFDFFNPQHRVYLIANVTLGVLLLPLFIWLFKQLSKNDKPLWVENILSGSGWRQANDAGSFLNEIAKFERED